jgi:uncharacterized membrane protein
MVRLLVAYGATLVPMLLLDSVWLSVMGSRLYRPTLGDMALDGVRLVPALLFYALYPAGLVFLAVWPALKAGGPLTAALQGGVFGLVAYATYDLTNQATLRNWSTTLSLVDIGWGTVLSAAAAAFGCWVTAKLAG